MACKVDGCEAPHKTRQFCVRHYSKWKRYKNPTAGKTNPDHYTAQKFLLAAVCHQGADCLLWPFYRDAYGYGRSQLPGMSSRLAHRLVCELAHGPAPHGNSFALHLCRGAKDGCINPLHLKWGDALENAAHKKIDGTEIYGESRAISVLKEADVKAIRKLLALRESQASVARKFGVSPGTIQAISEGRTWRHVP